MKYLPTGIIILLLFFSIISKSQNSIEYAFPKNIENLISKEFNRDFYDKKKEYIYITLDFDCDTIIAFLGHLDKEIPKEKITPIPYIINTNRYLTLDSLKIPIVFTSDFRFSKNSFVVKEHGHYIMFGANGKIFKSSLTP